ncbi:osmotically-inducible lipoprotein OsmE [Pseudomonas sp. JM0905a]|uniref:Osmotically-inducible lipoprotein OsmE n=1 Tax=Metapseudomonas resinovorans TaxID=53412 RepID=A0ABT4Y389_METRE|nr:MULTISPECIES: osmotically-inducible lipoprotein OsmE [Pseudomonas]MBD2839895.1 osmotically-inducible lipoprotein OsmE [Pseudomonas sp. JM0905a]MDA8483320.1 osmotically-inducible lipoprotein OsmE [Pseudomonas resinovorans]
MKKLQFVMILALAALGGCFGNPVTYRDEPLVAKVQTGMSKQQVLEIGGRPALTATRKAQPGTCNEYLFTHMGERQPYMVSFDANDNVDHKDFRTCAFWDEYQENAKVPFYMDPGYGK